MTIGETLLKISDYPFAYAVVLLLLKMNGIDPLSADATPYLLAAGIGATVLAVVDPIGRIVKRWLMLIEKQYVDKKQDYDKILKSWKDVRGAFSTQPIEKEKDRIVSTAYFLILLGFLMSAVHDDSFYSTHFVILYKNDPSCNLSCSEARTFFSIFAVSLIIAGFGAWNGVHIFGRVRIVAIYLYCKNSPSVSPSSIQAISDFIKSGDWKTAESWKDKITIEYLQEEGLRTEREAKFGKHVLTLLTEFQKFKNDLDAKNHSMMLDFKNLHDPTKQWYSLEDIFKKFPLYESLVTHLYTNDDKEIFNLIHTYMSLISKMNQENVEWEKTRDEGVNKIVNSILIYQSERAGGGIRSDSTNEWINIAALKLHLENFITTKRETLIPVERTQPNSALYKVRFFDRTGHPELGDDRIAELREPNATRMTNELRDLAITLRQSVQKTVEDLKEKRESGKQIEEKLDFLFTAVSVGGEPLAGSCKFCRNNKFFDEVTISSHKKELEKFPWEELGLPVP